jgi:mevalonate kinase
MKLSKIILENNKIVARAEINLSEKDINTLTETISRKLGESLDVDQDMLKKVVKGSINELLVN